MNNTLYLYAINDLFITHKGVRMNFETIYLLLILVFLMLLFIFNKNARVSIVKLASSILKSSVIVTILIFIGVFFIFDNLSFHFLKTSFLSPFFFIVSFITYIFSFDILYENDKIKFKPIINFVISIFQISIISFFLDVLFTMSLNIFLTIFTATLCLFLFVITNLLNKNDYPKEYSAGYDALIALAKSLTFYTPFGIIAYHFKMLDFHLPLFVISILAAIFIDFISPVFNNKKLLKFATIIKVIYIIVFLFIIPSNILVEDIVKPTFIGNIAILIASFFSLVTTDIQTKIYKRKYNNTFKK